MNALSDTQRQDVQELLALCRRFKTEAVIIGATAYQLLVDDPGRQTLDIDLALALEVEDLLRFEPALVRLGWTQAPHREHRWTTPRDSRFDLLPAGPRLRRKRTLVWPRSGFVMNLQGFEHVFRRAVVQDIGGGLHVKVIPPAVLALLKIVAYLDDPVGRAKDLDDLKRLFRWYAHDSERIYSGAVLQADLPDIEFASAFLLGRDVRDIASVSERRVVRTFISRTKDAIAAHVDDLGSADDWTSSSVARLRQQLLAFEHAFARGARQR